MTISLSDYATSVEGLEILGHLAVLQTGEAPLLRKTLFEAFKASPHLDEKMVPMGSRPDHAFRRATGSIAGTKYELQSGEGLAATLMVRDVFDDHEKSIRHLVREVRDRDEKELHYDAIAMMTLRKEGAPRLQIGIANGLEDWEHAKVNGLMEEVLEAYRQDVNFLPARALYSLHGKIFKASRASQVARQCYFVPNSRVDIVRDYFGALRTAYAETELNPVTQVIPILDAEDQRIMVAKALSGTVALEMVELNKQINQALAAGTVPTRTFENITMKISELRAQISSYKDLVSTGEDTIGVADDMVSAGYNKLLSMHVKGGN